MYEESAHTRPGAARPWLHAPVRWLRLVWPLCCALWCAIGLLALTGTLAGSLAGCVAPYAPTAAALGDASGPAGLPGAVAAARAAGGPLVASTAAALRAASGLNLLGGLALIAGFVYGCVPRLPTGVGIGLALGGVACLLAGVLLPLLSGWVGLGLLLASGGLALLHHLRLMPRIRAGLATLRSGLLPVNPSTPE